METLRSLLWQCISLSFLILFIKGTTAGGTTSTYDYNHTYDEMSAFTTEGRGTLASTEATTRWTLTNATLPAKEHQSTSTIQPTESTPTAPSDSPRFPMDMDLTSHETSKEPPVTKPAVSHLKIIEATTWVATIHSSSAAAMTQVPEKSTWSGEESTTAPTFAKHPSDTKSTAGKTTPSTFSDLATHTEGRTSVPSVPLTPAPVPAVTGQTEEERGPSRPHQNNHPTAKETSSHNSLHSNPTVEPTTSPVSNISTGIILLIVFAVLLILVILVVLFVRYRRRSGSTSISSWSGPAQLGDATALDGDAEQGEEKAGEGGTRRSMPLSSFGKHQSRVSSIPMEDMKGKGEREEVQQLLKTGAGGGANLEGPEEANGNLGESPMPSSGEASTSKAGGGASI